MLKLFRLIADLIFGRIRTCSPYQGAYGRISEKIPNLVTGILFSYHTVEVSFQINCYIN